MEKEVKSCFYCEFRNKINPDEIRCMKSDEIFEETFGGTIARRHSSCPLSEEEEAPAFNGVVTATSL